MRLRARLRRLAVAAAAAAAVAALLAAPPLAGVSHAAVSTPSVVPEGPDFATQAWSDPWDFSGPDDLLLDDGGPAMALANPAISGGTAHFTLTGNGYISPLWTGYPGSLQMGRDGTLSQNTINANYYRDLSIRIYTSTNITAGLFWFNCGGQVSSCMGGTGASFAAGWHTYTFPLANNPAYHLPVAWSGSIHGLRIAMNAPTGVHPSVQIDWIRLYQPGASGYVSGTAAGSPLYYRTSGITCEQLRGADNTDLAALPPGTYQFSTSSSCTGLSAPVTITSRPTPVLTAPTPAGQTDYASTVLRNPWDLNSSADVARTYNICGTTYASPSGAFTGYNCGVNGHVNDPQIYLHVGSGSSAIPSWQYHRATVVFTYAGGFNLANTCHGGTMGRVLWYDTAHPGVIMQSKPWVTYADRSVYTFDLAAPTSQLNESSAPYQYPFAAAGNYVTAFRWDPNEDQCSRWFHLYGVTLNRDASPTNGVYTISWHDPRATSADRVSLYVVNTSVSGSTWQRIAYGLLNSASGASYAWRVPTTAGHYKVLVRVYRNGSTAFYGQSVDGPVTVP